MKKYLLVLSLCLYALVTKAQIEKDPSHWAYGLKKLTGNTYEVHLRCTLDAPWHIYSQRQSPGFIGIATKITFKKVNGLKLLGKPTELGKKITYNDKEAGIINQEFEGAVDFVQKITIAPSVKEINGTITFQTCTNTHCLTAKDIDFTVPVSK